MRRAKYGAVLTAAPKNTPIVELLKRSVNCLWPQRRLRKVVGVMALTVSTLAVTSEAMSWQRLEFFDARSNSMGYAIIQYGRIDLFDAKSNWVSYGPIEGGQVNLLDSNSSRLGHDTVGPGGIINFYDPKSKSLGYGKPDSGGQTINVFDGRSSFIGTIKVR